MGGTKEKALDNLKEAIRLFLEEAEKMGRNDLLTLNFIDLSGKIEPVPAPTAAYQAPVRPSPD